MAVRALRFARLQRWAIVSLALLAGLALACKDDGGESAPKIEGALGFGSQPGQMQTAFAPLMPGNSTAAITVEILDDEGTLVADATDEVTIALEANPGTLLLHASGILDPNTTDNEGRLIELVDVVDNDDQDPTVRYILEKNWRLDAPTSMAYDAASDRYLLVNRAIDNFYRGDPRSGEVALVGNGTTGKVAGMAFEVGGDERLFAVHNKNFGGANVDSLFEIDPATGEVSEIGTLTPTETPGGTGGLLYFSGMAMVVDDTPDPPVGTLYATAAMNGVTADGHVLVEIDPEALTARFIGDTGTKIVALAAHPDGTLYGITGANVAPGVTPEDLVTIDTTTGARTSTGLELTNGADGEALVFVPARLYGTLTATAVNGVASFDDLHVDALGDDYTLTATAMGRAAATSSAFDVDAPTPGATVRFVDDLGDPLDAMTVFEDSGPGADSVDVTIDVALEPAAPLAHDVFVTAAAGGTASDVNDDDPDSDLDYLDYVRFVIPAGDTGASFTVTIVDDQVDDGVETAPGVFEDETIVFHINDASLAGGVDASYDTLTITIDDSEDAAP